MVKKDFRKKKVKDEFKREFGVLHTVFAKMLDILRVSEVLKKQKGGKTSNSAKKEPHYSKSLR